MNRRGFFGVFASVAATATLDPERLLWVPGKLISIPAPVLSLSRRIAEMEKIYPIVLYMPETGELRGYPGFENYFGQQAFAPYYANGSMAAFQISGALLGPGTKVLVAASIERLRLAHNWPSTGTGA